MTPDNLPLASDAQSSSVTQFLDHLRYERNVSVHTLRNYESDLQQFVAYLVPPRRTSKPERQETSSSTSEPDIKQIDHITIREWLASLHSDRKKKSSIARKLAALRTFFQFLVREGVIESNPAKLVATPRKEKKLPVHLSVEDAVRFIETPDAETHFGKRDRAILELLYATGVRVSELVQLNLRDIDFSNKLLRVFGKRRKERIVPFGEPAAKALQDYLSVREQFLMNAPATKRDAQPLILNYQGTQNDDALSRPVDRKVHQTVRRHSRHQPARAASFICDAPARQRRRPAGHPGPARPRPAFDNAGLHARFHGKADRGLRQNSPQSLTRLALGRGSALISESLWSLWNSVSLCVNCLSRTTTSRDTENHKAAQRKAS